MEKVKVSLQINDYKLETTGYLNKNILSFYDKDQDHTNIIYDYNTDTLIRDNKEITIKLNFKEKENNIKYQLKETSTEFSNNLIINSLLKNDNTYIIKYRIEENTYNLTLKYRKE